jgi:outer membrane receptor protein involved in Fe transport
VSYNYRDEFLVQCFAEFSEPREREEFGQVDLSASYSINERYQVFFEGINVLDEERRDFSRFENRFLTFEDTGPRYTFGIRGAF